MEEIVALFTVGMRVLVKDSLSAPGTNFPDGVTGTISLVYAKGDCDVRLDFGSYILRNAKQLQRMGEA